MKKVKRLFKRKNKPQTPQVDGNKARYETSKCDSISDDGSTESTHESDGHKRCENGSVREYYHDSPEDLSEHNSFEEQEQAVNSRSNSFLVVVALDFGTTFSGYAFSFLGDPLKIQTNAGWVAGSQPLMSLKTPTCILLNREGEFDSFGYEAEDKFASLASDDKHHEWRLFRRFKMILHKNKTLSRTTTVEDLNGNPMSAFPLFAMTIRYLKEHLLEAISKQKFDILDEDIQYVLTVPAIWDDNAKQFMREAAIEAGIDTRMLKLALEPEAASIWCEQINPEAKSALLSPGTQFMVVDLGGGTADISVQERKWDGTLKEIHHASGGPWGSIYVDENYMNTLTNIFGEKAMNELRSKDTFDFFDLQREFEVKKRSFKSRKTGETVLFRICAELKCLSEECSGLKLEEKLATLDYGAKIVVSGRDKLRVDTNIVGDWFDGPVNSVIKHMKELLSEQEMQNVNTILLVGGFGESKYVHEQMKSEFANKHIIVPDDAGLVVLKGAVRFGHEPEIVTSRVMKYTYGIEVLVSVDEDGNDRTRENAFYSFLRVGEEISVHQNVTEDSLILSDSNETRVDIYRSVDYDPEFTDDDGCEILGTLTMNHPFLMTPADRLVDITFLFGDTELLVKATRQMDGKEDVLRIDCLR